MLIQFAAAGSEYSATAGCVAAADRNHEPGAANGYNGSDAAAGIPAVNRTSASGSPAAASSCGETGTQG